MYAGEVAESGSVRDVFHRPAHPYTEMLLRSDPGRIHERTRQLPTIPGEIPNLIDLPEGCVFRPRCPKAFDRCFVAPPAYEAGHDHHATCHRSEEHTSELQSLMRISSAVFCLKKK